MLLTQMGGKRRNALKKKSRGNETECTPTDSRASVKLMICGNLLAKEPPSPGVGETNLIFTESDDPHDLLLST